MTEVISFISTRASYYMITERWNYKLPYNLGSLRIRESIGNKGGWYTDWIKTQKRSGIKQLEYNLHTNGRRYYMYWDKNSCPVKNKVLYRFEQCTGTKGVPFIGKRGLSTYIFEAATNPHIPDFRANII